MYLEKCIILTCAFYIVVLQIRNMLKKEIKKKRTAMVYMHARNSESAFLNSVLLKKIFNFLFSLSTKTQMSYVSESMTYEI